MEFSSETIHLCWQLAQGRCECQRDGHGHEGRCPVRLIEGVYGYLGRGGWFVSAWTPRHGDGGMAAEDCEALCADCYERAVREAQTG